MSVPFNVSDESITTVLQTAMADINSVWTYDPLDLVDPWKAYNPQKAFNDLLTVNSSMGLWVRASAGTDAVMVGTIPQAISVQLQAGWNLIGYPSFILRTMGEAFSTISHSRAEGFDATSPESLRRFYDSDDMVPGDGYWIKLDAASTWDLTN